MDLMDLVMRMLPYWFLGIFMIYATIQSGNKDLLRFEKGPFLKFCKFMVVITIYRLVVFHFLKDSDFLASQLHSITQVPWQSALTVFWEDMSFAVPLVLLKRFLDSDKHKLVFVNPEEPPSFRKQRLKNLAYYASMAIMMLSFGSGHIYQGWYAAALLSMYVPFSVSRGQKYGFGTVIACHMLYDLSTILSIKWFLGL